MLTDKHVHMHAAHKLRKKCSGGSGLPVYTPGAEQQILPGEDMYISMCDIKLCSSILYQRQFIQV